MKKLIILTILTVGCAKTIPATEVTYEPAPGYEAPAPAPEVAEETRENPYVGAVSFLRTLLTITPAELKSVCAEFGGQYNIEEEIHACQKGLTGFAVSYVDGVGVGASILIPGTDGELIARALEEEVGQPDGMTFDTAVWKLEDGVLVFTAIGNVGYILVLDTEGSVE